ncbi:Anti-sigma regulatory factor (Ser/Thr protein kinase) [Nonomuraea solani]|uniref:Anti-sigma regulatory factor (Ser/Thr protein kinase) n=1 Tax=Nonomuraea solani TaxID=1144553 RepID=A0A1H6F0H6_9ACTN|nr:ATP-binding protein [Nonomuraea solani]SEH02444.1 Anti-sigma regulatory factor (Ser/Thr protein kinase) [Nonomuraea solani]
MSGKVGGTVGDHTALGDPLGRDLGHAAEGEAKILLTTDLDEDRLASARRLILRAAREQGLESDRLGDFVMAAYEGIVNAVEHGGGRARLTLWRSGDELTCAVEDAGPGIPASLLRRTDFPPSGSLGGRGIWLMRRLTDEAVFTTGPGGTVVRLRMRLPTRRAVPHLHRTPQDGSRDVRP